MVKQGQCINVCLNYLVLSLQEKSPSSTESHWVPEQPPVQMQDAVQQEQGQQDQEVQGQQDVTMQGPTLAEPIQWDAVPQTPPVPQGSAPPTPLVPAPLTPQASAPASPAPEAVGQGLGQEEQQEQQDQGTGFRGLNQTWSRFKSGQFWWGPPSRREGGWSRRRGWGQGQ